jgi:hypothetical protein
MTETREAPTTASRSGTYRAAVVHNFGEPLTLEHIPALPLEPGQMRVKV